ncbi:hypothetical protein A7C99_4267 [Trichophyton rubrum]|uniref:Uncharacterized protein n=1 Tax=Trichophyton rubrum TaxID=5551 RepID=A0A178EXJ2_TRIRU|nr:hypothetical protein A7C99_4267 [Trichophyton rubrum]
MQDPNASSSRRGSPPNSTKAREETDSTANNSSERQQQQANARDEEAAAAAAEASTAKDAGSVQGERRRRLSLPPKGTPKEKARGGPRREVDPTGYGKKVRAGGLGVDGRSKQDGIE